MKSIIYCALYQNQLNITLWIDNMSNLHISSLNQLFDQITSGLFDGCSLESMKCLIEAYKGYDWTEHVTFSDEKYYRQKVFLNDVAELIIISWKANKKTPIHDHPDGGC